MALKLDAPFYVDGYAWIVKSIYGGFVVGRRSDIRHREPKSADEIKTIKTSEFNRYAEAYIHEVESRVIANNHIGTDPIDLFNQGRKRMDC